MKATKTKPTRKLSLDSQSVYRSASLLVESPLNVQHETREETVAEVVDWKGKVLGTFVLQHVLLSKNECNKGYS